MKRVGKQSYAFVEGPSIEAAAVVVGPKEGKGMWRDYFDRVTEDHYYGMESFEKAEQRMMGEAAEMTLERKGLTKERLDLFLGGDLLNQTLTTNITARSLAAPFIGLYGACSTFASALLLGSMLIDAGYVENCLCGSSSHYCTAERQFRMPVEYGGQPKPWAQWTVTAAGTALLGRGERSMPRISRLTIGKVVDLGTRDPSDMGSAMAPAAADTILAHFREHGLRPDEYDLVLSGDLGAFGTKMCRSLLREQGLELDARYNDCGVLIFQDDEEAANGGSGAGCSTAFTLGPILAQLQSGQLRKVLIVGTGALLSSLSTLQGESIPGIAHAVAMEGVKA